MCFRGVSDIPSVGYVRAALVAHGLATMLFFTCEAGVRVDTNTKLLFLHLASSYVCHTFELIVFINWC